MKKKTRWPRFTRFRSHIRPTSPSFTSVYFAIPRAYYTLRTRLSLSLSLSVFFLGIRPPTYVRPAIPRFFCTTSSFQPLKFPSSSPPSPCPQHPALTSLRLIFLQPPAIPYVSPSLSIAHVLRLCSFTIPPRPPPSLLYNDAFISPYPHRCHIALRACLSPAG